MQIKQRVNLLATTKTTVPIALQQTYFQSALVLFRGSDTREKIGQNALKERYILGKILGQVGVTQRMNQNMRLILVRQLFHDHTVSVQKKMSKVLDGTYYIDCQHVLISIDKPKHHRHFPCSVRSKHYSFTVRKDKWNLSNLNLPKLLYVTIIVNGLIQCNLITEKTHSI